MTTRERMEMAMERWKAAERASTAAGQAVWTVEPLDPARDALRARYADARKAEGEAAAEYHAAVAAHRNG